MELSLCPTGKGPYSILNNLVFYVTQVVKGKLGKLRVSINEYPTRQIDSVAEAHIIDRVKELRGNLTSRYKKSGNFAVTEADVSGINKSEFYAQSSINELKEGL